MKNIIFIGGTGRCGTSLFRRILGFHEDIFSCGKETQFLPRLTGIYGYLRDSLTIKELRFHLCEDENFFGNGHKTPFHSFSEVISDSFKRAYDESNDKILDNKKLEGEKIKLFIEKIFDESFVDNISKLNQCKTFSHKLFDKIHNISGKKYFAEKTPWTIKMIDKIYYMFPDMKYIHLIREPKDVISSKKNYFWNAGDVKSLVKQYNDILRASWFYKKEVPEDKIITVNFERFIRDIPNTTKKIFNELNINIYDEFINQIEEVALMDRSNINRYKKDLSIEEIRYIDKHCGEIYNMWNKLSI